MTQYIDKSAIVAEIEKLHKKWEMGNYVYNELLSFLNTLKVKEVEVPISNDLEEAANDYAHDLVHDDVFETFIAGALWQKDHTCFAERTKTIEEIKEALLSEVLPCFMHGGEADEVVAKLDEVLSQK